MQIIGNVDVLRDDVIAGWPASVGTEMPVKVVAMCDGVTVARGQAGTFRQDVLDAGHPGGNHGFVLELPENHSLHSRSVHVFEAETMTELAGSPTSQSFRSSEHVFDISDLFFFLVHHDNPSGIQRVQISVISTCLRMPPSTCSLNSCTSTTCPIPFVL